MDVLVWAREASSAQALAEGHRVAEGKRAIFETSDALSLHMRPVEATRVIVTASDLGCMKTTSFLPLTAGPWSCIGTLPIVEALP